MASKTSDPARALIPTPRMRRLAEKIHELGPLPLAYMLAELAAGAEVVATAEGYARLPGSFIRAYGADRDRTTLVAIKGGLA